MGHPPNMRVYSCENPRTTSGLLHSCVKLPWDNRCWSILTNDRWIQSDTVWPSLQWINRGPKHCRHCPLCWAATHLSSPNQAVLGGHSTWVSAECGSPKIQWFLSFSSFSPLKIASLGMPVLAKAILEKPVVHSCLLHHPWGFEVSTSRLPAWPCPTDVI